MQLAFHESGLVRNVIECNYYSENISLRKHQPRVERTEEWKEKLGTVTSGHIACDVWMSSGRFDCHIKNCVTADAKMGVVTFL